jgi:hypothetical protein
MQTTVFVPSMALEEVPRFLLLLPQTAQRF